MNTRFLSVILVICFSLGALGHPSENPYVHQGKLGVRGASGVMGFLGSSLSFEGKSNIYERIRTGFKERGAAGIYVPVGGEITWDVLRNLQLSAGFSANPMLLRVWSEGNDFAQLFKATAGFRYFFNVYEPLKFYVGTAVTSSVASFNVGFENSAGFQFDMGEHFGIFIEEKLQTAVGKGTKGLWDMQMAVGGAFGFQYWF